MNKTKEALKMAIEQIKWADHLHDWHDGLLDALQACKEALEQPSQHNFCQRCGKRASKDPNHIHTCTPPQALKEKNNGI